MKKFRVLTIVLAGVLALSVVLCVFMPDLEKGNAEPRYHQHLRAQEKPACEHTDDTLCSHLPLITIDTDGGEAIPGVSYYDAEGNLHHTVTATGASIIGCDVAVMDSERTNNHLTDTPDISSRAEIRVRGNSSRHFIKHSYAINLLKADGTNNKQPVMGMDKHHEWVMHGPILDKTLIRNYLCYNLAGELMEYAPNVRFCEAVINGSYSGLYVMVESITAGDVDTRLNLSIDKKDNTFTGYCLRLDRGSDTDIKNLNTFSMYSKFHGGIIDTIYPGLSNLTEKLKRDITLDFSQFERTLYSYDYNNKTHGYTSYIDVDSFVNYFLVNEFTSNYDAGAYSTYIYKETGGKYKLCVWDFNNACDNYQEMATDLRTFQLQNGLWFEMIFKDSAFIEQVIARYTELRQTFFNASYIDGYITDVIAYLGSAIDRNYERWSTAFIYDLLMPIERNPRSYEEAVQDLRDFFAERGKFMDENIYALRQYADVPLGAK
ncbi:MAG: spore coat protein CotH [Clostridiales bacterium]|nr:spore coat protein CotH [Clostridiales bacterium]